MPMTSRALRLLACQIDIPAMTGPADRDAHLARTARLVSDALTRRPADLVVLPELSSLDYSRAAFERLDALAEPLEGPSFAAWSRVAREHGAHVVFGFARRAGGNVHISSAVAAPDGRCLGAYDKLHLCQYGASMEKEFFTRGDHLLTFDVNGITCAPIICYDIRIPELARCLTLRHGVELMLHCGAYARDASFATWHEFITARALENQLYLLSLNRAGVEFGGSAFCSPWMDETRPKDLFEAHAEELRWFDVDAAEIARARRDYTFLGDRLPDYHALPVVPERGRPKG